MSIVSSIRDAARAAPESGIVSVVNYGRARAGLIPLWAGEGDLPTPRFITDAASRALANGETFYTWTRGIPDLREALARYHARHFDRAFASGEFIVTGSGMAAIQLALQATLGAGEEAIFLSPAWPNFAGAVGVAGAVPVAVPLGRDDSGWHCDLDRVERAINPRTRVLFVNTPSNPTGWTASRETLEGLLALARRHGLWIVADEIYALFFYGERRAPSFFDIAEPEDRILFVNTFSKNWAMTGWRIGWLRIHPALEQIFENLVQYSTSGVAQFMQRGAIAALDEGDGFIAEQVARAHTARDRACEILLSTNRVVLTPPEGAFYLFFGVDGLTDSAGAALRIVDEANVGLAPGTAFGQGGETSFRLCFHRRVDQVEEAATRLADWIRRL
ncbi:MAG: pyridoxal phosphate-dependent aminotransferase [Methylobacterium mesophilicum]|nr:pyridoxal phosphate-dependent aminotransferase [Methylobacterium mesophilicum]